MFVHDTDGRLMEFYNDSLWPEGPHPGPVYEDSAYTETSDPYTDTREGAKPRGVVPSTGLVALRCPFRGRYLKGRAIVPDTDYVGKSKLKFIPLYACGRGICPHTSPQRPITAIGSRAAHMPWRHLHDAVYRLYARWGYWRERLGRRPRVYPRIASQGDGGGTWNASNCKKHYIYKPSSHECAFEEGLANYGGHRRIVLRWER